LSAYCPNTRATSEQRSGGRSSYFTIMRSVFDPEIPIHETYDIKGSTFKRKMKEGERVRKDEDWVCSWAKAR